MYTHSVFTECVPDFQSQRGVGLLNSLGGDELRDTVLRQRWGDGAAGLVTLEGATEPSGAHEEHQQQHQAAAGEHFETKG